jgi:hypothetical protein
MVGAQRNKAVTQLPVLMPLNGLTPQYWTLCYDSLSFRITIKKHLVKLTRGHVFQTAMHASLVVILHVFADYGVDIKEALKLVQPIAFLLQDGMKCLDVSVHIRGLCRDALMGYS